MTEFNPPGLPTLPWEAGRPQAVKAWVCLVNATTSGKVLELNDIERIESTTVRGTRKLELSAGDEVKASYNLAEVWGAWLQWPYKTYHAHHLEEHRLGPEWFLEFAFAEYEWVQNGVTRKRYTPSPQTYSIWCDDAETGSDPIVALRTRWDGLNKDPIGWFRSDRVRWQKLIRSVHHPDMP